MVTAYVVDGRAYSGTSNVLSIATNVTAANQTAAVCLFNPAASGINAFVYGWEVSVDTPGVRVRFQHVTVDPALGTAVTPINRFRQAVLGTSSLLFETSVAAGLTIPSTNLTDVYMTGIVPIIPPDTVVDTWLSPGTGIYVSFNEETASTSVNVALSGQWVEFAAQ